MKLHAKVIFRKLMLWGLASGLLLACTDEPLRIDSVESLRFSTDTLSLGLIFNKIISPSYVIKVHNPHAQDLQITSIGLEGKGSELFRLNVDGALNASNHFADVIIKGKDSLFIFIKTEIPPAHPNSEVEADIVFRNRNSSRRLRLEGRIEDVEVLRGQVIQSDSILDASKPYFVYDSLVAKKNLTLLPGCRLYFYNRAYLRVGGRLEAIGTAEEPISLRGHRQDAVDLGIYKYRNPVPYNYIAGQWKGIYLTSPNSQHRLVHVHINSSDLGIYLKNEDLKQAPTLELINSRLHNFSYYGIIAQNAHLNIVNSEISNAGINCLYLNGGKHNFIHCTIANYFGEAFQPSNRNATPSVMLMDLNRIIPMETYFYNSVIMGSSETEFNWATQFPEAYRGSFANSYIRRARKDSLSTPQFQATRWYQPKDTVFRHPKYDNSKKRYFDFSPDSVSPLRALANPTHNNELGGRYREILKRDLNGNERPADSPSDAGAYQWISLKQQKGKP